MNKPIRIMFCIDSLVRGGTELQLIGLIERLERTRFEPYLVTIREFDSDLVPRHCVWKQMIVPRLLSVHGVGSAVELSRWMKQERIDVVHTFFPDSTAFATVASLIAGIPVRIAGLRDLGFWATGLERVLMRLVYGRMTAFIANANAVRAHFAANFGVPASLIHVLRNGLDVESMRFVDHCGPTRAIGIVGNMTRSVKRFDLFVRAAARIAGEFPDVTWHVIGDGHLRDEFEELARSLRIESRIVFSGSVIDIPDRLERIDVGVVCSESEGLSNAILEYMCKGSTTIATRVDGNQELVDDEVTGLLVTSGDEQHLADAMARLIRDPALRRRLARNAREKVETNFSWNNCVRLHQEFYERQLDASM